MAESTTVEVQETEVANVAVDPREEIVTAVPMDKSRASDPDDEKVVETKGTARLNSAILVLIGVVIGIIFSSIAVSVMWGTIFQNAASALM